MRKAYSIILFSLVIALGAGTAAFLWYFYHDEALQRAAQDLIGGEADLTLVAVLAVSAVQALLFVLAYALSLDARARRRPFVLMSASAFATGLSAGAAAYAWYDYAAALSLEYSPLIYASGAAAGLAAAFLVILFELANRRLWGALVSTFDKRNKGRAALFCSRMALLFRPGQQRLLRSVTMERFRHGARGDVSTEMRGLYQSGDRTPELLELLCQLAAEEKKPGEYLEYLGALFAQYPQDEQLQEAYLQELLEQGRHAEALEHMEKHGVPEQEGDLEQYANLLLEAGQIAKAVEVAERLGNLEGIPMKRSDKILREVLSLDEENVQALNLLADHAERMARRDQEIRWLEKSLQANPKQTDRRLKLLALYEERGMSGSLEELLSDLYTEAPRDQAVGLRYAHVLQANGKPSEALKVIEKLEKQGCGSSELYRLKAEARFEQGSYDEARDTAEFALSQDLSEDSAASLRGLLRRIEEEALSAELADMVERSRQSPEDRELGLATLERLLRAGHPDRAVAQSELVLLHHKARPEAIRLIETALQESTQGSYTLLNYLADLQVAENRFDDALVTVQKMARRAMDPPSAMREGAQKILHRSPHHLKTLETMGNLCRELGQFTEMIHYYSLFLANGGEESEEVDRALANAYLALKDYQSARRFVFSLLDAASEEVDERDIDLLRRLIPLAVEAGAPEDAAEMMKRLEGVAAGDKETQALRRFVEESMGEQRLAFLKRELEAGKGSKQTLEELGDICRERGDLNQAITYYQRAARQQGATRLPIAKLAYCFARKRLFDMAGETLSTLKLSLSDDEVELDKLMIWLYRTAEVLEEAHLYERAARLFKQLMKIDAGYKDVLERVERLSQK